MYWIIAIFALLVVVFLVWASADISGNVYLKAHCKGKTDEKVVALTFDDGPDGEMTSRVLDILKRYEIKATFFLIGEKAQKYPTTVKRIVDEGHIVANHTYTHSGCFPMKSVESVCEELRMCNDTIFNIADKRIKLFRPPFGVTNPIIGRAVRRMGFHTIGWSIRSLDTISRYSREHICERVIRRLHPGAIILLHDRCADADILLERVIPAIREQGYRFVSLSDLLHIEDYEN